MSERDAQIAEIRQRHAKITPGPWHYEHGWCDGPLADVVSEHQTICGTGLDYEDNNEANAHFIASAPEDIAYLLDQLAAQDAEIATLIATLTKERDLWRREAKLQAGDRREP